LLANLGLLQLLINELGWDATLARLVSAGSVAILSFAGHKLYSFKGEYEAQSQRSTQAK
jgi:putative flippase GtrA